MYDPMKAGPEFGSELERRATPQFAAKARRSGIVGLWLCLGMGLVAAAAGIRGLWTHETFRGMRGVTALSAPEFAAMGVFLAGFGVWGLIREARKSRGNGG
jgi:hypothetical protein